MVLTKNRTGSTQLNFFSARPKSLTEPLGARFVVKNILRALKYKCLGVWNNFYFYDLSADVECENCALRFLLKCKIRV